ncbi:hypothetical protein BDU57DRAFT_147709 [Ampelomyces quisqualis]|uniref:Uncharacterized protein n=1 Tax=Ampelomyces quisqualis TaxID=50730 RepID=A0A6A5QY89_AMPQU|nr:hypothetical protein BDU57DRAFT_147709 [Ampelomyces quisqualis]
MSMRRTMILSAVIVREVQPSHQPMRWASPTDTIQENEYRGITSELSAHRASRQQEMMCHLTRLMTDVDRSDARSSPALIIQKPIGAANTTVSQLPVSSLRCGPVTALPLLSYAEQDYARSRGQARLRAGHVCISLSADRSAHIKFRVHWLDVQAGQHSLRFSTSGLHPERYQSSTMYAKLLCSMFVHALQRWCWLEIHIPENKSK